MAKYKSIGRRSSTCKSKSESKEKRLTRLAFDMGADRKGLEKFQF